MLDGHDDDRPPAGRSPEVQSDMPTPEPLVRASHLKEDLDSLACLGPDAAREVRARLSPASIALIEGAARTDWLPIAANVEMVEAVYAVAGAEGARAFGRASFLVSLKGFFRPLLQAITALFDPSPAAICRFAPRAWVSTYRGCGTLELLEVGEAHLRVALVGFPEPLRRAPFLTAFAGTFEATCALGAYEGNVEIARGAGEEAPGYLVTWRRRERPAGDGG